MSSDQPAKRGDDELSAITIRQFSLERDYYAVTDLWENSGAGIRLRRSDHFEEIEKKVQRDPDLFLVAESADRIALTLESVFTFPVMPSLASSPEMLLYLNTVSKAITHQFEPLSRYY